jgi:polygalacturonase
MTIPTRREFLGAAAGVAALGSFERAQAASQAAGWDQVPGILARIKLPSFPSRDFDVTKYGATGDGAKDCTAAINRAIQECNRAGGGRVVVPQGVFFTAAIHLLSNVDLHLVSGATLRFDRDPRRYLPLVYTRWEGVECMNYSAFVYADGQENIAVSGEGTLDGNCDCEHWWPWKGRTNCGWTKGKPVQDPARNRLFEMGAKDVPVQERRFGEGSYLRPSLIQFCHSKNVLIEGLTLTNSPMFEVNPVLCTNVTVRNIKINSHGPNNDGCDPDSSRDVLIENCVFDTGDDCIAIKSGRNRDGRRVGVPSENVIIRNCEMKDGHGGVTIGSEMSGGVRNVFAENCRLNSPNLNEALRFKTNAVRGGTIENAYFRNLQIGEISDAILQIDFYYEEGPKGPERPVVRNIDIRDVTCRKAKYALNVRGFPNAPIRDIRLERCTFEHVASQDVVENVQGLTFAEVSVNGKSVQRS